MTYLVWTMEFIGRFGCTYSVYWFWLNKSFFSFFFLVIIGTCAYIIEITGEILVNCGGRRLLDEQIMSLITMFVDEVPNVTLNVMLAACREVPTSYYALIKAVLNMIGAFIRSIKVIRGYFSTRKRGGKTGIKHLTFT